MLGGLLYGFFERNLQDKQTELLRDMENLSVASLCDVQVADGKPSSVAMLDASNVVTRLSVSKVHQCLS